MKKDTKTMIVMIVGTFIVGVGSELITPSSLVVGSIVGLVGCALFFVGAFFIFKSMIKNVPNIISITKKVFKNKK